MRAALAQALPTPRFSAEEIVLEQELRGRLTSRHRLGPLLHRGWPTADSAAWMRTLTIGQLGLQGIAGEVTDALTSEGIECRILKGLATAELDYSQPAWRHTGDVDVLIALDDLERATDQILSLGATPMIKRSTNGRLLKGATFRHPLGPEIDLHYRLSVFYENDQSLSLFDELAPFGHGLTALSTEARLIHTAVHSLVTRPVERRLSSIADIVVLLGNPSIDWQAARTLADTLGVTGLAGAALRLEADLMTEPEHPGLSWPGPTRLERHAFLSSSRRLWTEHFLAMRSLPPGSSKGQYVSGWLRPSDEILDLRGGRRRYFRRLLTKATRRTEPF